MSDSIAEDDDMIQAEGEDADSSEEENARTPSLTPNAMN